MPENAPGAGKTVAFIGLGTMGLPMAMRLRAAGHDVRGSDVSQVALSRFAEAGAGVFATPEAAASGAQILITMLPDGAVVRDVLLGAGGAAAAMRAGGLIVDMSSSAPLGTRELGRHLAKRGLRLVDAPVSGGVRRAIDGTLTVMAGGEAADVEALRPLLGAMATTIIHTGPLGCGHAMKALNNYVSAAGLTAACEAILIGKAFGIAPDTMVDVLNVSSGRNNSTEVKLKPFILTETFASGFSMALMSKDLRTAADLARDLDAPAEGVAQAAALWSAALSSLGNGADHTEIFRFLQSSRGGASMERGGV